MRLQKRLSAKMMKCSHQRVHFDTEKLSDIKEAITKADIRGLIKRKVITELRVQGIAQGRARKTRLQKKKGRQRGFGSRKGRATARDNPKKSWMNRIRAQRSFLKELKSKGLISLQDFHSLYLKAKGGFFRSVGHIKLYATEHDLFKKK